MLKTSQLQCFVAVAETLHFGQAAARLEMTQPPLSRQIQMLEKAVGCALLHRDTRSVQLTQAGKLFLPEAQRILRLLEHAADSARNVSDGYRGTVNAGFTASTAYEFLPSLVGRMQAQMPEASLVLREMVSSRQIAALEAGELDIGFLRLPVDPTTYNFRTVAREPMVLALPEGHPFLDRPSLSWHDVDRQPLLMYDSRDARYFYELLVSRFVPDGIHPVYTQRLSQIHSILSLVRAGMGLAIVPESSRMLHVTGIALRHFADAHVTIAELMVAWRVESRNPLVPLVVEIAAALHAAASTQPRP